MCCCRCLPLFLQLDVGVRVATKLGQDVVLVGSHPTMGSWSIDDALPLTWSDGHVWRASIELPRDCAEVEYKVRRQGAGVKGGRMLLQPAMLPSVHGVWATDTV